MICSLELHRQRRPDSGDDQAYDKPKNTTGTGRRPDLAVHDDLIRRFFETRFQASAIKAAAIVRVSNQQKVEKVQEMHTRDEEPLAENTWMYSRQTAPMKRAPWLRFDADAVVHGSSDPLLAPEITFGCLHRNVSEKKLNLVQFSAGCMAQLRARTPEIMRR